MEGRSFELSEDESSVDGGEENEDGHGDQLSALRREPSGVPSLAGTLTRPAAAAANIAIN